MIANSKVVIVQPYVPTYRVAFFDRLRRHLANQGIECIVAAGVPEGTQKKRADAVTENWIVPIERRIVGMRGNSVELPLLPTPWQGADAVILGLEGTALPVYQALLHQHIKGSRVGLWGHIKPYVTRGNKLDLWLERRQMIAADHIFAYTEGGRQYALGAKIDPEKITTVMNSIDTSTLEQAKDAISPGILNEFVINTGINPKKTICFVGALDETKRIDLLAGALDKLWAIDPEIKLLIGGEGEGQSLLQSAIDRRQAIALGYLDTDRKALAIYASNCMVIPGRIGLVAVDALVMQKRIITTNWPYHAPEVEYLTEGENRITSLQSSEALAATILKTLRRTDKIQSLPYPNINDMVHNFSTGIEKLLAGTG